MKQFPVLFAFVLVTGSGLRPACPHTSATVATFEYHAAATAAGDPETTCDPAIASATPAVSGRDDVYGDCVTAARAAVHPRDDSLWPRPRAVDRPPRWRRRRRFRPYGGGQIPVTPRAPVVVYDGSRDGKSLEITRPVGGIQRLGRPRTGMKTASKMLLYALSVFFEQMELTVYLSLYKIKLLYNTLIAPMIDGW